MGVASMNCAATRHLHAGAFSKTLLALSSQLRCHTRTLSLFLAHTQTHKLFCVKDSTCKLHSSPLPLSQVIPHLCSHSLCLFEGCILVFSILLRAQVTLPTTPSMLAQTGP